jgi:regulator of protease activity HflC (stomatin/prohibitin superfamily)
MSLLIFAVPAAIILVLLLLALSAIRVVQQYERGMIFGCFIGAKGPGASSYLTHAQNRLAHRHTYCATPGGNHSR